MAFHSFKMILRSNHVRCASVPPEEAIRTAKSPITVPTKKAIGGVYSAVPSASAPQKLGGATRKWPEEPEDEKDIRQSLSNSSVSTMTSFEESTVRDLSQGSLAAVRWTCTLGASGVEGGRGWGTEISGRVDPSTDRILGMPAAPPRMLTGGKSKFRLGTPRLKFHHDPTGRRCSRAFWGQLASQWKSINLEGLACTTIVQSGPLSVISRGP